MSGGVRNSVIRDNVESNRLIEVPSSIRDVIGTIEFQRLRNIRQMGLSSMVFPTAEHSRFTHSLGVYATARQVFSQLRDRALPLRLSGPWFRFDAEAETDFCIAALCHDIGHTAFSHVLERVLLPDGFLSHEDCTRELIADNSTDVSNAIKKVADQEAVLAFLDRKHPNKALNDLISSHFDVDRCDYVLRDSAMSGVEYGKYDLKWLVHALRVVKSGVTGNPVLILDGPRGIDGLRQFLSARRYLHRQVYFHATVRSAQILIKGIFERMQDIGKTARSIFITPRCLHSILAGRKPTLGEFLETTDVEVQFMIRNFSLHHPDQTLRYLCDLFVKRKFPKCILDSSRTNIPLAEAYNIGFDDDGENDQPTLWPEMERVTPVALSEELRPFLGERLAAIGAPPEAAKYLVAYDQVEFRSEPPADLLFAFKDETVPLEEVRLGAVGFDIRALLERFTIDRFYVPTDLRDEAREFLGNKYLKDRVALPMVG